MGTTITISLVGERADSLLQKSFDLLKELEYRFNANSQKSELMEINHQAGIAPVKVHPDLFELISLGLKAQLSFLEMAEKNSLQYETILMSLL